MGQAAGASLLQAVGLSMLITNNLDASYGLAIRLATEPALLQSQTRTNRLKCPLFDTDRFRRNIEAAFTTMWETWQWGEPSRSFSVEVG